MLCTVLNCVMQKAWRERTVSRWEWRGVERGGGAEDICSWERKAAGDLMVVMCTDGFPESVPTVIFSLKRRGPRCEDTAGKRRTFSERTRGIS
jgi:hypothetical protein